MMRLYEALKTRLAMARSLSRRLQEAVEEVFGILYGPRRNGPPLPVGLVSFADAPWAVVWNSRDWDLELSWWQETLINWVVIRRVEEGLRTGAFRAGIVHPITGELFWAPEGTWRLTYGGFVRYASAVSHAIRLGPPRMIDVPFESNGTAPCIPFLLEHDLAACLGAKRVPPEPADLDLAAIKEIASSTEPVVEQPRDPGTSKADTSDAAIGPGWGDAWDRLKTIHGGGGPPTGMHLILAEMRRRFTNGPIRHGVREEARLLNEWYRSTNPEHALPTEKSIENKIRDEFRQLRSAQAISIKA